MLEKTVEWTHIPELTAHALEHYVLTGAPVGGFLTSVLENNLFAAVSNADKDNTVALPQLVKYIYNRCPGGCWGSPGHVQVWQEHRGMAGLGT